jgi:hypothetical protein
MPAGEAKETARILVLASGGRACMAAAALGISCLVPPLGNISNGLRAYLLFDTEII